MKKLISILSAFVLTALMLTACGDNAKRLDRIDTGAVRHITIATAANADPEYDIVKRKGIVQLVDIYNTAAFVETDEVKADDLLADTVYHFRFYDFSEKLIGECTISPEGYLFIGDDLTKPYRLQSEFDEEVVKTVIATYDINANPT